MFDIFNFTTNNHALKYSWDKKCFRCVPMVLNTLSMGRLNVESIGVVFKSTLPTQLLAKSIIVLSYYLFDYVPLTLTVKGSAHKPSWICMNVIHLNNAILL